MKHQLTSALPAHINDKRKISILRQRAEAGGKLETHIRPTFDRATGLPDGGTESAFTKLGVCTVCALTRDDIMETDAGKKCDASRAAFAKPTDEDIAKLSGMVAPDPLADVFA